MALFDRKPKQIQATEGSTTKTEIDSAIFGRTINTTIPGVYNEFTDYHGQVIATYDRYNGASDFGCQQVRAIVDIRSAFISGEGLSVSCKDQATSDWIEKFIDQNKLNGSNFLNAVKASEMAGFSLMVLDVKEEEGKDIKVVVKRYRYSTKKQITVKYTDKNFNDEIAQIIIKDGISSTALNYKDYVYIRTGGDDTNANDPTTRIGVVLTDVDNYDRALKDIRRNNHIFARVTPVFEVSNESEAKNLKKWLQDIQWKIGTAFIGKAKFKYESPATSAYQNIISEMTSTLKTISAVTGVPVHWLGHVDLMSNRATAESLYETIKNATIIERLTWQEAMYDIILKAQELYINAGGELILNPDFEVKIPLIDFAGFRDKISALSQAYADEAISMDDYRNEIPGINPIKTARAVEAEKLARQEDMIKMGVRLTPEPEKQNEEEGEEDGNDEEK